MVADPSVSVPLTGPERQRAFQSLFAGVAISTTGFLAANTVNGLVAEDLTGSTAWSGLPASAAILGTAAGATLLAALIRRAGPRNGLAIGYGLATVAMGAAAGAVFTRRFTLLVCAMVVFGAGFGANRLARYVAAELYPPDRRATMIGWIVWAATIGAVAGPSLLAPSRALAEGAGLSGLLGPYLVGCAVLALSTLAMLSAPRAMNRPPRHAGTAAPVPGRRGGALADPGVTLALLAMVSGQFVMVLLMTMTPLHIRHGGHGLGAIGMVIAAHTLGMYAVSPITGRLADRFGRLPLLGAGVVVLVIACLLAAAAGASNGRMAAALLLLGVGWNLGFVGGSALLTERLSPGDRVRVQGLGDALIWGGGAVASLASGWLLEHAGYTRLSLMGAVLSLVPAVHLVRASSWTRQPSSGSRPGLVE